MKQFVFNSYIILLFFISQLSCLFRLPQGFVRGIYYASATFMVAFTLNRSGDESRDDYGYKTILCQSDGVLHKDVGWYYLIDIFGGGCENYYPVIFLSAIILAIKLMILPRLGHNILPALFLYSAIYWELHDLTQLRLASSMLFVLIGLFFAAINKPYLRLFFFSIAGLFHIETLPLIVGDIFAGLTKRISPLFMACCLYFLVGSNLLGLMPSGWKMYHKSLEYPFFSTISSMLLSYSTLAEINEYTTINYPAIVIATYFVFSVSLHLESRKSIYSREIQYAVKSFLFGAFVVFMFSAMSDVMVRYCELYLVFAMFIAARMVSYLSILFLTLIGIMYFMKFNILWNLMAWGV